MKNKRRAFTLIELLVVIAIISILAAILFPVFAAAKVAAKKTADLSNLKQIGLASLMYSSDFDDHFARGGYPQDPNVTDGPWWTWRELTNPYVKSGERDANYNDEFRAKGGIWRSPSEPPNSANGYGAHNAIFPAATIGWWEGSQYDEGPWGPNAPVPSRSQTQFENPAGTFMHTTNGVNPDWNNEGAIVIETDWWFHGGAQWPPQFTGPTSGAQWDNDRAPCDWAPNIGCYMPRYRYNENANVAWVDGHAQNKKKGTLNWCTDIYPGWTHFPSNSPNAWVGWLFFPGLPCAAYAQ
jgi:prepilin-type N-terminal cleavage/methylation domain-containing protein/prepilin-type processing-associated H-X9-DG protein